MRIKTRKSVGPDFIEGEIWKQVYTYEDIDVSNLGRLRRSGLIRNFYLTTKVYLEIHVTRNGVFKRYWAHRLVIEAFGPARPTDKHVVDHINGIKTDNRVDNLRWLTNFENISAAHKMGLIKPKRGESNGHAVLTESDVLEIRARCAAGEVQNRIAESFCVSPKTISSIKRRINWRHV